MFSFLMGKRSDSRATKPPAQPEVPPVPSAKNIENQCQADDKRPESVRRSSAAHKESSTKSRSSPEPGQQTIQEFHSGHQESHTNGRPGPEADLWKTKKRKGTIGGSDQVAEENQPALLSITPNLPSPTPPVGQIPLAQNFSMTRNRADQNSRATPKISPPAHATKWNPLDQTRPATQNSETGTTSAAPAQNDEVRGYSTPRSQLSTERSDKPQEKGTGDSESCPSARETTGPSGLLQTDAKLQSQPDMDRAGMDQGRPQRVENSSMKVEDLERGNVQLREMANEPSWSAVVSGTESQATGDTDHEEKVQGEAEESVAEVSIEQVGDDDVVIAVMGPTGAGKSTLISSASGIDKNVIGHSLKSFTSEVHAIKFWDKKNGRHVVLVDTPGFDDTYKSDLDILTMISKWLNSSYSKSKLLSGILYLHRITDNRMAGTPLKNLKIFRELCGKDALDKVYLTTTMWDEVLPNVGERRLEELKAEYWKTMITQGAQTHECRSSDDLKELIRDIILNEDKRRVLQLQQEMGEEKKKLKETSAGKHLFSQLEELVGKQSELLQKIMKERRAAASDPKALADLQEEYVKLREQIDDKMRQMQELKLPWIKSIRRHVKFWK